MNKADKIQLALPDQCTGCAACASVCPTNSIMMREDKEGFWQPHIDADTCIKCHKCEKTCPIVSPIIVPTDFETQAYAAINKDETIRMRSSSGGIFYALAKWTVEQGGVVFGARFDENWDVIHDYTETVDGIEPFMRSKYVQSRIGDTFTQAKEFLKAGRQVLFVGTPCQIGGLHSFLGKDYENLIMVDFICHGVPSPKVWHTYLNETNIGEKLVEFNFRDKRDGWVESQCVFIKTKLSTRREKQLTNLFFRGFINNVYLRNSCFSCPFKSVHHISDITIADAWGIQHYSPHMNDNKGTSAILVHSQKGEKCINVLSPLIKTESISIEDVTFHNPSLIQSSSKPKYRRLPFYVSFYLFGFKASGRFIEKDPFVIRLFRKIKKQIKKLI